MKGQRGLIVDQGGALHMIEAAMAAALVLSTLACLGSMTAAAPPDNCDDLKLMSSDLLYVLEHGADGPGHPGLARALWSKMAWEERSKDLDAGLRGRMPPGVRAFLHTPYGDAGDPPPEGVALYVRPFLACSHEAGGTIECSLIVWRP